MPSVDTSTVVLVFIILMNVTIASVVGTTVVAYSCAPSQLLFDAVHDLSKMYLSET